MSVDALLSSDEILNVAEENQKETENHFRDTVFGLLDICMALLIFLPLFASKSDGVIEEASLLSLVGVAAYLKAAYFASVAVTAVMGVLTLALQNCKLDIWIKIKTRISLALGVISSLLFTVSLQPYAAVFAFSLLAIKAIMLIKRA